MEPTLACGSFDVFGREEKQDVDFPPRVDLELWAALA